MTSAGKSVYYFGIYILIMGVSLAAIPNVVLSMFQIAETGEVWIRVLGGVVFTLGIYYVFMAPGNHVLFFSLTVYGRMAVFLGFVAFVLIGWGPVQLILFGLVDLAGATWTYIALKKQ